MAKRKSSKKSAPRALTLIVSGDKKPRVALKAGMRLQVISVALRDPALKAATIGGRLCGGTSTCLALVHTGDEVINPQK
jgi:hypothetical protein